MNAANGGSFSNFQESFFFAEVLKYAYLIHADPAAEWQVGGVEGAGKNEWVYNTEAHPFKVSSLQRDIGQLTDWEDLC